VWSQLRTESTAKTGTIKKFLVSHRPATCHKSLEVGMFARPVLIVLVDDGRGDQSRKSDKDDGRGPRHETRSCISARGCAGQGSEANPGAADQHDGQRETGG
jgi:hypothetical protein